VNYTRVGGGGNDFNNNDSDNNNSGGVRGRGPPCVVSGANVPGDLRAFEQCLPASSCLAAAAAVYDDARPATGVPPGAHRRGICVRHKRGGGGGHRSARRARRRRIDSTGRPLPSPPARCR